MLQPSLLLFLWTTQKESCNNPFIGTFIAPLPPPFFFPFFSPLLCLACWKRIRFKPSPCPHISLLLQVWKNATGDLLPVLHNIGVIIHVQSTKNLASAKKEKAGLYLTFTTSTFSRPLISPDSGHVAVLTFFFTDNFQQ